MRLRSRMKSARWVVSKYGFDTLFYKRCNRGIEISTLHDGGQGGRRNAHAQWQHVALEEGADEILPPGNAHCFAAGDHPVGAQQQFFRKLVLRSALHYNALQQQERDCAWNLN